MASDTPLQASIRLVRWGLGSIKISCNTCALCKSLLMQCWCNEQKLTSREMLSCAEAMCACLSNGTSDMQHAGRVLLHVHQEHASFVVSMAARESFSRLVRRRMACCGCGTSRALMFDSCRAAEQAHASQLCSETSSSR